MLTFAPLPLLKRHIDYNICAKNAGRYQLVLAEQVHADVNTVAKRKASKERIT